MMPKFHRIHDTTLQNEYVPPLGIEKQKFFVENAEKVLQSFKTYRPDYAKLNKLMKGDTRFEILGDYSRSLIDDMTDYLLFGIRHSVQYMAFLKTIFLMFSQRDKDRFASKFIDTWQSFGIMSVPHFEEYVEDFQKTLTEALRKLETTSRVTGKIKDEISWLILVSPQHTVQQILTLAIENSCLIPLVVNIFRRNPSLFYDRKLKIARRHNENVEEKILVFALRKVIANGRLSWTKGALWDNLEPLVLELSKHTFHQKALLSKESLLDLMLRELCSRNRTPMKSVETIANITNNLLDIQSKVPFQIKLATSMRDQAEEGLFLTPSIFIYLLRLLSSLGSSSTKALESTKGVLKSIGARMKEDNRVFDEETRKQLLEGELYHEEWWIEYCMSTWFFSALKITKRRLPSGIYVLLPDEIKSNFKLRGCLEDADPLDAYRAAIRELELFDMERAMEVRSFGTTLGTGTCLIEKIEKLGINIRSKTKARGPLSIRIPNPNSAFHEKRLDTTSTSEETTKSGKSSKRRHRRSRKGNESGLKTVAEEVVPATAEDMHRSSKISALEPPLPPSTQLAQWPSEQKALSFGEMRFPNLRMKEEKVVYQDSEQSIHDREKAFKEDLKKQWAASGVYDQDASWKTRCENNLSRPKQKYQSGRRPKSVLCSAVLPKRDELMLKESLVERGTIAEALDFNGNRKNSKLLT